MVFLGMFGQSLDFRSPETQAIIPTKRELMKHVPDRFRDENGFFLQQSNQKTDENRLYRLSATFRVGVVRVHPGRTLRVWGVGRA